jgi:hypothetical protein
MYAPGYDLLPYWSLFDLLGLFLSLLGPAPAGAGDQNFFFPLAAVYAKWCAALVANQKQWDPNDSADEKAAKAKVPGDPPSVVQCTRQTVQGLPCHYFLGASVAGFVAYAGWPGYVRAQRYELLNKHSRYLEGIGARFDTKIGNSTIGNCAETYPFANFLYRDPRYASACLASATGHITN